MPNFGRTEAEAMMEEYGYCKHSDCRALVLAAYNRGAAEKTSMSVEYDKVVKLFYAQTRSADMWIEQYNKYKDVGGIRIASLAIGKLMGLFNVLTSINAGDRDVEKDIPALMEKYSKIWDNLTVEKGN
jgi:hypothetical protein